ncbi:T9SS type A sorting domain-containing protein [Lentimicrobium sp.]
MAYILSPPVWPGSSFAIDVSNLNTGFYFMKINSSTINISTKLIVKP